MPLAPAQPDALLARMGSLADPIRLRLLRLLERQELGVVELCDVLQLPQSTVSRHLKILADQGWLGQRRRGTARLYGMILDELDPDARDLWVVARDQTAGWATASQDALRLQRVLSERPADDGGSAFFAGRSGEWDRLRAEFYGASFLAPALAALLPSTYTVADLGCGTGGLSADLAPHVGRVVGVDASADMLAAAAGRCAALDNVDLHRGDLADLPLDDAVADAAVMVLALSYVDDPAAALTEMSRVLKPGGKAVVVDLLPHDRDDLRRQMGQRRNGFDPADLSEMLADAGLADAAIRPLPPEPGAKGSALFLATASRRVSR